MDEFAKVVTLRTDNHGQGPDQKEKDDDGGGGRSAARIAAHRKTRADGRACHRRAAPARSRGRHGGVCAAPCGALRRRGRGGPVRPRLAAHVQYTPLLCFTLPFARHTPSYASRSTLCSTPPSTLHSTRIAAPALPGAQHAPRFPDVTHLRSAIARACRCATTRRPLAERAWGCVGAVTGR